MTEFWCSKDGQVKQTSAPLLFVCHIKHSDSNIKFFIEVTVRSEGHG